MEMYNLYIMVSHMLTFLVFISCILNQDGRTDTFCRLFNEQKLFFQHGTIQ